MNGTLNRWDAIVRTTDRPNQGSFNVYRTQNDQTMIYGCGWLALASDRSEVRADCVEGGAAPGMEAPLSLALLQGRVSRKLDDRTILGQTIPCYEAQPLTEVCANDQGYVLYLAFGRHDEAQQFEATEILRDVVEPFSWPFVKPFTPTTSAEVQLATSLDLPSQFHLRSD
jgi:hypothetical protein